MSEQDKQLLPCPFCGADLRRFAKAIAARCGDEQTREKKDLNTNAESFRRAVDAMQKEKRLENVAMKR